MFNFLIIRIVLSMKPGEDLKLMSLNKSYRYKVVLIGDQAVGKSSLITRYVNSDFEELHNPTIGIDFLSKIITLPDESGVRLQIWDTAGQERFRSLIPGYLRDCSKVLIVFDLTLSKSFESIKSWVEYTREIKGFEADLAVVGNKADLIAERRIDPRILEYLRQQGVPLFEVSAKEGTGVEEMFVDLCVDMVNKSTLCLKEVRREATVLTKYAKRRRCC